MKELSLFSGAGGGLLGTKLLGFTHIGYVEYNEYCQKVIAQRIKDRHLDEAPIFGDIRAFLSEGYAESYKGLVDVITAGFPCQPFSSAGKGLGVKDSRNMWPQTRDCIGIIRPTFCFLENVPGLLAHRYIQRIFGDLAEMGYNAKWGTVSAENAGAIHKRKRFWVLAYCKSMLMEKPKMDTTREIYESRKPTTIKPRKIWPSDWGIYEPSMAGLDNEMANWVERSKAIGNGQVPAVVKLAWETLTKGGL